MMKAAVSAHAVVACLSGQALGSGDIGASCASDMEGGTCEQIRGNKLLQTKSSVKHSWIGSGATGVTSLASSSLRRGTEPSSDMKTVSNTEKALAIMQSFKITGECGSGNSELIRLGSEYDGGYVTCDKVPISATGMISIGIRGDDPVSTTMSEMYHLHAEQYDCFSEGSPCPEGSKVCSAHFNHICAGAKTEKKTDGLYMSLEDMIKNLRTPEGAAGDDLVLKIDCENCEWDTLDALPSHLLKRFSMIIGEFHDVSKEDSHDQYLSVMTKLGKDFRLVHTHGCNCIGQWQLEGTSFHMPKTVELLFVRNDLSRPVTPRSSNYLHELDSPVCKGIELYDDAWNLP